MPEFGLFVDFSFGYLRNFFEAARFLSVWFLNLFLNFSRKFLFVLALFYLRLNRLEAVGFFLLLPVYAAVNQVLLFLFVLFVQDSVFHFGAIHLTFFVFP